MFRAAVIICQKIQTQRRSNTLGDFKLTGFLLVRGTKNDMKSNTQRTRTWPLANSVSRYVSVYLSLESRNIHKSFLPERQRREKLPFRETFCQTNGKCWTWSSPLYSARISLSLLLTPCLFLCLVCLSPSLAHRKSEH